MPIPSKPPLLRNVIGYDADVFSLPDTTVDGSGALSYESGWPRITATSLKAGGKAPQREYFNQVNKLLSQHLFFLQSGNLYDWSASLNYNAGAHVLGSDGLEYVAVSPSGPDVPGVGAKDPAGSRNKSQWLLLAALLMSSDGGLVIDPVTGKASVDFAQMPTDKFETILKQIRVPIWLERNTSVYVRKTGSDSNPGTLEAPFLTINKALQYVCENYNMSGFKFVADVGEGEFDEDVQIPSFTATTGFIEIKGVKGKTIVKGCLYTTVPTGRVSVDGLSIEDAGRSTPGSSGYGGIFITSTGQINLYNTKLNSTVQDGRSVAAIRATGGGAVIIREGNEIAGSYTNVFFIDGGTAQIFKDVTVTNVTASSAFASATNLGIISSNAAANGGINPVFKGNATGRRYAVTANAIINVKGGNNYFPGNQEGIAANGGQYL